MRPDYRGPLEPGLVRPTTLQQLVSTIPATGDSVEYVREVSRVANAAPVAEATAATGATGLKPEGGLVFEVKTEQIRTIAERVPATTRILRRPLAQGYVDQYLTQDIAIELEDQMAPGPGACPGTPAPAFPPVSPEVLRSPPRPATSVPVLSSARGPAGFGAGGYRRAGVAGLDGTRLVECHRERRREQGTGGDVDG